MKLWLEAVVAFVVLAKPVLLAKCRQFGRNGHYYP